MLLLHVKGAQSFKDSKSYEEITYDTYADTAKARNLINTDEEWEKYLSEACKNQFPIALCNLFKKFKHNLRSSMYHCYYME